MVPDMTRTKGDVEEVWRSAVAGPTFINRLDHRGELSKVVEVAGGTQVHLTDLERRLNQQGFASVGQDLFTNGTLIPVDGVDAAVMAVVAANPNVLGDDQVAALVMGEADELGRRLAAITSPVTLGRLEAAAQADDVPVSRGRLVRARIDELSPRPNRTEGPRDVFGHPVSPH
jgi:hypothetical protein